MSIYWDVIMNQTFARSPHCFVSGVHFLPIYGQELSQHTQISVPVYLRVIKNKWYYVIILLSQKLKWQCMLEIKHRFLTTPCVECRYFYSETESRFNISYLTIAQINRELTFKIKKCKLWTQSFNRTGESEWRLMRKYKGFMHFAPPGCDMHYVSF